MLVAGALVLFLGRSLPGAEGTMRIVLPILPTEKRAVSEADRAEAENDYRKAGAAAERKNGREAMRWALRVLHKNPDHEGVRAALGYRLYQGSWRTAWEIDRLERGFVDHPVFGWMPASHVKRYEAGQRLLGPSRWVTVEEETRSRREMRNGWTISSEHYELRTNHSLEEGVRTIRRLEHLYRAWKLLFFEYLFSEETLVRMFRARPDGSMPPRHEVFLYRNRKDYVENLKGLDRRIAQTNGYYYPDRSRAYFFPVDPEMDEFTSEVVRKTLFHEGTHQLFQEARRTKLPGSRSNFWLVEGIAMFMETLRIEEDRYVLGDPEDDRLYAAKAHKTRHDFYVPFGALVKIGGARFQAHPQIVRLYSQSAGMTHFLMFWEEGRYRGAVVALLRQLYDGTDRADSLEKLTGLTSEELDARYAEFLETVP